MSDEKNKKHTTGFEEVLDLIPQKRPQKKDGNKNENFALLNILEHEEERLKKLSLLLEKKIPSLNQNNSMENLIETQKKITLSQRQKIISHSGQRHSAYYMKLNKLFNRAFNKIKN